MTLTSLEDRERGKGAVAGNPINLRRITRKGVYGRPDVQHDFAEIKREGLPQWLHDEVEHDLGRAVDRHDPDALGIQKALQILADYHDAMGVDHVEAILQARRDGSLLSDLERQTLSAAGQRRRSEMLT